MPTTTNMNRALTKAVELYIEQDFDTEMREWNDLVLYLKTALSEIPHVRVKSDVPFIPGHPGSYRLPATRVEIDQEQIGITYDEVADRLREGSPRIFVGQVSNGLVLRVHMLREADKEAVVARFKEILGSIE